MDTQWSFRLAPKYYWPATNSKARISKIGETGKSKLDFFSSCWLNEWAASSPHPTRSFGMFKESAFLLAALQTKGCEHFLVYSCKILTEWRMIQLKTGTYRCWSDVPMNVSFYWLRLQKCHGELVWGRRRRDGMREGFALKWWFLSTPAWSCSSQYIIHLRHIQIKRAVVFKNAEKKKVLLKYSGFTQIMTRN